MQFPNEQSQSCGIQRQNPETGATLKENYKKKKNLKKKKIKKKKLFTKNKEPSNKEQRV